MSQFSQLDSKAERRLPVQHLVREIVIMMIIMMTAMTDGGYGDD